MPVINSKIRSIIYASIIEGTVVLFSTFIQAGPCGPTDEFSGFLLLFTILFHVPGLILGGVVSLPLSYFLPAPWDAPAFVLGTIGGNFLFLSWLIYKIREMRNPSYR